MLKIGFKFAILSSAVLFLALGGCSQCTNSDRSSSAPPPPPPAGAAVEPVPTPPLDASMNPGADPSADGLPMDADGADPAAVPPGKPSTATEGASGLPASGGTDAH